jgi:hypothetical protein
VEQEFQVKVLVVEQVLVLHTIQQVVVAVLVL